MEARALLAERGILLTIFGIGIAGMVWLARRQREGLDGRGVERSLAIGMLVANLPVLLIALHQFDPLTSLPLHLCGLAWPIATIALWTRARWAVSLLYFWGLTLTIQGVVTPVVSYSFPDVRYIMFFVLHYTVVWAAIYVTMVVGGPGWDDFRFTVTVTLSWATAVIVFNAITGANYGYLNQKPDTTTILDLLGPWPVYVAMEVLIVALLWAIITLPWTLRADEARS